MAHPDCICAVLGAGLAGLSAAHHLGPETPVFEAASRPGGECVTDGVNGFQFDRSGHLLHLRTEEVRSWIQRLLPGQFQEISRDARIHLLNTEVRYPIQANTFGLPPEIKAQCLQDYLAAAAVSPRRGARNFLEWSQLTFGRTLSRLFFEPYNRKLWTVEPSQLTLEWMGSYVPQPDLPAVMEGAFFDRPEGGGYNARFWYPKQGGIECLAQALAAQVPGLHVSACALRINPKLRQVEIGGIGTLVWQRLISSLPLPALVALLEDAPPAVTAAARRLQSNSVLVVNLGVRRARLHRAHWLYFPEGKFIFYRVGFPSNFGQVAPEGCSSLYAEVALPAGTGWEQRKNISRRVRKDLQSAGIIFPTDEIMAEHWQYLPYAYVIFDRAREKARQLILDYLQAQGILSIGRWGAWEYSAMEDALLAGRKAAEAVLDGKTGIWKRSGT